MKNPITWFFDKTNMPNEIDTVATMNVEIKQGEKVGKLPRHLVINKQPYWAFNFKKSRK